MFSGVPVTHCLGLSCIILFRLACLLQTNGFDGITRRRGLVRSSLPLFNRGWGTSTGPKENSAQVKLGGRGGGESFFLRATGKGRRGKTGKYKKEKKKKKKSCPTPFLYSSSLLM
ncbi:hypothetical protein F4809DRAFT_292412 [Biscogniauxia mediterranea]|nr:hypothetical protein F4809DRAFT_292412 [Biscogniauxia mediterranea]